MQSGKKGLLYLAFMFLLLMGCSEDNVQWVEVTDGSYNEVLDFMIEYAGQWEESLEIHNFSIMESFFIPNSQVYHMQRRQHQTLVAERSVEVFNDWDSALLEENEFGEYRWTWMEKLSIEQGQTVREEKRTRMYYISRNRSGDLKITAISRVED